MNYDSVIITLEERTYDVCAGFGKDRDKALAIILGHELIHFYEKHGFRRGFAIEFNNLQIGMTLEQIDDYITNETEADYLGGFLAYTAGFDLFDRQPDLIAGVYKAYNLPDKLAIYPSLQDRQAMSRLIMKKIDLLADPFEMANLMTILGHYSQARVLYNYVLQEYQSREIFNNLGVVTLLEVLSKDNEKMHYPIELDLSTRSSRGSSGFASIREQLLHSAIRQFDAAINLDVNYAPAYLNKACAYALLKDYTRARFYADTEARQQAKANGYPKTENDADVLLGIIAYSTGDSVTARQIFEKQEKTNAFAEKNLAVLLRKPEEAPESSPMSGSVKTETIDSIVLSDFADDLQWDKQFTLNINPKLKLFQYNPPGKNSRIYILYDEMGDEAKQSYYHVTRPKYTGQTVNKGIKLGATRDEVEKAFKKPLKVIATPKGEVMVYKKLIFMFENNTLVRWINYYEP